MRYSLDVKIGERFRVSALFLQSGVFATARTDRALVAKHSTDNFSVPPFVTAPTLRGRNLNAKLNGLTRAVDARTQKVQCVARPAKLVSLQMLCLSQIIQRSLAHVENLEDCTQ